MRFSQEWQQADKGTYRLRKAKSTNALIKFVLSLIRFLSLDSLKSNQD